MPHAHETLDDGLPLIVDSLDSQFVTGSIVFGGAKHDRRCGLTHMVEHALLMHGGPNGAGSTVRRIERPYHGAVYAETDIELCHASIRVPRAVFPEAFSAFVEYVRDVELSATRVRKEITNVVRELRLSEVYDPGELARSTFDEVLVAGTRLCHVAPAGSIRDVRSTTTEDVRSQLAELFRRTKGVVVAGGITLEGVRGCVPKLGSTTRARTPSTLRRFPRIHGPVVRRRTAAGKDVHLCVGYQTVPRGHPDAPALYLLASVLFEGFSSVGHTLLVDEEGLSYGLSGSHVTLPDARGAISCNLAVAPAQVDRACARLAELWERARTLRLAPDAAAEEALLAEEKATCQSADLRAHQDDEARASWWRHQLTAYPDEVLSIEEYHALRVAPVTVEDLRRVARTYLRPERGIFVATGRVDRSMTFAPLTAPATPH